MDAQQLDEESFDVAVRGSACLVVAFGGKPAWLDSTSHAGVRFAWVDSARHPRLAAMFGLGPEPAVVVFREAIVLYCEAGTHTAEAIEGLLARIGDLDMERVRAEIEQERQAEVALRMRRVCPTARRGPPGG